MNTLRKTISAAALFALLTGCDDANDGNGSGGGGGGGSGSGSASTSAPSGTPSSTGAESTTGSTTGSGGAPQGSVTIRGTGFGTKAAPGPILFDDFEMGTAGAKVENQPAVVGAWQSGAGSEAPEYTDETVRSGARACRNTFTPEVYNASLAINADVEVAYLDYWTRVVPASAAPEQFSRNWKPFRFYGADDALQSGITSLSGNEAAIVYFSDADNGNDFTEWTAGYPVDAWFHVQAWIRLNDVGQANGTVMAIVGDQTAGTTGAELRGQDVPLEQLRIGHYWATDGVPEWPYENEGADVFIDDVYFDSSWARVEVGNAPTYEAATHREIQLVTAWSDTAVTFTPRRGTLPAGQAWAYVLGEDGSVLATEEIVLQ